MTINTLQINTKNLHYVLCISENSVSLHPQNGPVAQLNRVSDYGSEGYRFEPYRGHSKRHTLKAIKLYYRLVAFYFYVNKSMSTQNEEQH